MGRRFSGNGGGRPPRAANLAATVPAQTGVVATVGRQSLLTPVSYAKAGGNGNLAIDPSSGSVSAAAAIAAGVNQALTGTVTGADGCIVPFSLSLTGAATVPAAPTIALTPGDGQVSIAWTDGSANGSPITVHKLYRGTTAGAETLVGTIASASPYVDTGLGDGTAYFYKRSAVNALGESPLSAEQSATPANNTIPGMPAYYLNFTTANTTRLKAMKQAAINGTGRGRILGGMDSFMAGFGATPTGTDGWLNTEVNSMMTRVAYFLNAKATPVPSIADFSVPDQFTNSIAKFVESDPRWTYSGSSVSTLNTFPSLGGWPIKIGSGSYVEFTPANAFDTIDLLVLVDTGAGSLAVSVDHGATTLATINVQDTTQYVKRVSVTCPAGSMVVRLTRVTGNPCVAMIGTRNAAGHRIELVNAGASGRVLGTSVATGIDVVPGSQANTAWTWLAGLPALLDTNAINACILQGGFNDWNTNGNDANAAAASLTTAIQNLQAYGVDVVYVTYGNINIPAWVTSAQDVLNAAAIAAGVPVIDARQLMGSWASGWSTGYWYDNYHMRPYLQDVVAQTVANIFDYL